MQRFSEKQEVILTEEEVVKIPGDGFEKLTDTLSSLNEVLLQEQRDSIAKFLPGRRGIHCFAGKVLSQSGALSLVGAYGAAQDRGGHATVCHGYEICECSSMFIFADVRVTKPRLRSCERSGLVWP